jgi:orotate phosphoribosyltransferase
MPMTVQKRVAEVLLEVGAVRFDPYHPVTFKSGIISPVYVDNRLLPFYPKAWATVIDGFCTLIDDLELPFDALAGIETAGIPHSAALAYAMEKPSVFVRKEPKEHGLRKRVEGGDVAGKRVLLIEDLVTTGRSSLKGVDGLREAGATVHHCYAIVSYNLPESLAAFQEAKVRLHTLTNFDLILQYSRLAADDMAIIQDWLREPYGWAQRYGHHPKP